MRSVDDVGADNSKIIWLLILWSNSDIFNNSSILVSKKSP